MKQTIRYFTLLLVIIGFTFVKQANAQCNLVGNPGFENFTAPCNTIRFNGANGGSGFCVAGWFPALGTFMNAGTPDYFNACAPPPPSYIVSTNATNNFGSNNITTVGPNTGNGYAGFFAFISPTSAMVIASGVQNYPIDSREYIRQQLAAPLMTGHKYQLEMWVKLAPYSKFASGVEMALTTGPLTQVNLGNITVTTGTVISFSPTTISGGWVHLQSSCFVAANNYTDLTIGNFNVLSLVDLDPSNLWTYGRNPGDHERASYYYVDDVSIEEIKIDAGIDQTICPGNSVVLNASNGGCNPNGSTVTYSWIPSSGLSSTTVLNPVASPSVTTDYTLTAFYSFTTNGIPSVCTATDNVTVSVISPSLSLTAAVSPTNIVCSNTPLTLTTNLGSNITYTWTNGTNTYNTYNPVISPVNATANPVSYTYTVTAVACGQTYTASTSFTVQPGPGFTITPTTICEGGTVAISVSNSTITSISFGDSNFPVNPHQYNTAGIYTVSIGVYDPVCPTTFTDVVTVLSPSNQPTISVNVNPTAFCAGQTVTLTASGASTYTFNSGFSTTTVNPAVFPVTATTIFTVTGTDVCNTPNNYTISVSPQSSGITMINFPAASCGNVYNFTATPTGCISSNTVFEWTITDGSSTVIYGPVTQGNTFTFPFTLTGPYDITVKTYVPGTSFPISQNNHITVFTLPGASAVTATPNSVNICTGSTSALSASGAVTYTWSTGSSTYVGNPFIVTPTVSATYTVTGTDACGMTSSDTVQVIITTPFSTPSIFPSQSTICIGNTVLLSAVGLGTWNWSTGATTSFINVTPTVTTTYSVTGQTSAGCIGSASITITVNPANTFSITATASSPSICAGGSSTLTTTGPGVSPVWQPAGTGSGSSVSVSPPVTTTYTVTSTSSITACTSTAAVTVYVNSSPAVSISPSTICAGQSSVLTASGANTYTWYPGATNGNTLAVTPSVTTNYTVVGTSLSGCTSSAVATVYVNNPSVTASASPSVICNGTSSILTATGSGSSVIWYPVGLGGISIAVTPSATTTYTVIRSNPITGCSGSAVVTVSVVSSPTLTVNSLTICAGDSGTLTASGATSYTWSNGAHTSTIVVSPSVTTTYTVSGTNANGCVGTTVTTVTVQPVGTLTLSSGISNIYPVTGTSVTASVTVSPAGTYAYSWSPSGGTSSTATFVPTNSDIYICKVTGNCATATVSMCIAVQSTLCSVASATTISTATISANQSFSNTTVSITGTLTVASGATLDFIGSTIKMSTDARIIVEPTSQITLLNSKLFSCEGMWYGIEAQSSTASSATVSIRSSSLEDAFNGIVTQHNFVNYDNHITITSSVMNKNYIDILLQNSASPPPPLPYPLVVESSTLTSAGSATSPGNNLKCSNFYTPTIKSRSYAGLYASIVNPINFINNSVNTVFTTVQNKDYGLYFKKTNSTVYFAQFLDMKGAAPATPGSLPVGVGIVSLNKDYMLAKPLSSPVNNALQFKDVAYGIITNKTTKVEVNFAKFNNPNQSNTPGGLLGQQAIYTIDAIGLLRLNSNTIGRTYYAITSTYSITSSPSFTLSISQNTIGAATGVLNTAVDLSSALTVPFIGPIGDGVVAANLIDNADQAGIRILNVSGVMGLRVSGNTITLRNATNGVRDGILLNGGNDNVMVDNNSIDGNLTASPVGSFNIDQTGIRSVNSPNCLIQCNTVTRVGKGIVYSGNNATSAGTNDNFFKNTLNYNIRRGLELNNGAILGTQGNSSGASANTWNSFSNISNVDQTVVGNGATASSAINSVLYVRNNSSELPTDNDFASPSITGDKYSTTGGSLIIMSGSDVSSCQSVLTTGARVMLTPTVNVAQRNTDYASFITSVITPTVGATWQAKWLLAQHMHKSIRRSSIGSNTVVASFYAAQQSGDMGNYFEIDSLIGIADTINALSKNNSAPLNNDIESTYHDYNGLYLSGIVDAGDYKYLKTIAELCAYKYGNAVYKARALMNLINYDNLDYPDNCDYGDGSRIGHFEQNEEETGVSVKENMEAKLFPNPNNGSFTLAYDLKQEVDVQLQVTDISGKLVYSTLLDFLNNLKKLDLNELQNGMYFIQLINGQNKLLWTNKMIINK